MFDWLKKKKETPTYKELINMSLREIWTLTNQNNFLVAMFCWVGKKCGYGDCMDALSPPERIFYITQSCEAEVNNGGFAQFLFNYSGAFANEAAYAFTEIGAMNTAQLCSTVLKAYGGFLPADFEERQKVLDSMESDELERILTQCDSAFYRSEDDLVTLNYAYVMKNRTSFS